MREIEKNITECINFLDKLGLGKFQLIDFDDKKLTIRGYNCLEDVSYIQKFKKAHFPISAYTGGIFAGVFIFLTSENQSVLSMENLEDYSIEQIRCQAEDGFFTEISISNNLSSATN